MKKLLIFTGFLVGFYFYAGVTPAQAACISFSEAALQQPNQSESQIETICRTTSQVVCPGPSNEKYCCDTQTACTQLQQLGTPNTPTQPGGPCAPETSGLDLTNCYLLNPGKNTTVAGVFSTPAVLINLVVKVIFIISGIILFLMVIYSGILFISGGTKGQEQAKNVMTSAIAGMVLVFAAYWIMQLIKIVTGANIGF